MQKYDVIIVGSGPAGLMCAANLEGNVLLIEKNQKLGGKITVSGGGRCNVTNKKSREHFLRNVPRNSKFLFSTLNNFYVDEIIKFFEENGCMLKEEKNNRMFPLTDQANDIVQTLVKVIRENNVKVQTNLEVETIEQSDGGYLVNNKYLTKKIVIATGGRTYPKLGTSGFGYQVAERFGLKVIEQFACEAPVVSNDQLIQTKLLQGISLQNVTGTVYGPKKKLFSTKGDLVFTHFGLSGPLIHHLSYYIKMELFKAPTVKLELDLSEVENIPSKLNALLEDPQMEFKISDVRGFNVGFVTAGGVDVKEINPKTFESKKQPGIFFIGEVLDVNAFTGGYNITICLSEGFSCAKELNQK